jgi:hypothetical protein
MRHIQQNQNRVYYSPGRLEFHGRTSSPPYSARNSVDDESWSASSLQVQQDLAMKGHMAFPQRGIRQPSFQASILLVPTLPFTQSCELRAETAKGPDSRRTSDWSGTPPNPRKAQACITMMKSLEQRHRVLIQDLRGREPIQSNELSFSIYSMTYCTRDRPCGPLRMYQVDQHSPDGKYNSASVSPTDGLTWN